MQQPARIAQDRLLKTGEASRYPRQSTTPALVAEEEEQGQRQRRCYDEVDTPEINPPPNRGNLSFPTSGSRWRGVETESLLATAPLLDPTDEGAMKKCQSAGREAWGCKLPTEADRPELLYPAPRQLVIALLSSEFLGATRVPPPPSPARRLP